MLVSDSRKATLTLGRLFDTIGQADDRHGLSGLGGEVSVVLAVLFSSGSLT